MPCLVAIYLVVDVPSLSRNRSSISNGYIMESQLALEEEETEEGHLEDEMLRNIEKGSADMRWLRNKRVKTNDVLRHPADVEEWKHFDSKFSDFASDPWNVHLRKIDVYLQPLIEELKELWTFGGGVQRGIRHVQYTWVIDRRSGYEVEYPSWDIDAIF
ncbi:uncharacterized protein E5676_scaffold179G00250 [Cucumis melo var. makuwa]|uniref:Uncharacterized protein n=1 Tax=Cucumis melo var. makuwa TaxID=1194695 RepID=A0A5D3CNG2_CUCMM|nr:uncharacterized protein E6C27_scaffold191G00100 [Cucumis melo var. makuwa]TYK13463.1 uncharacterized protein E5676_scaffold179G00250 [Cucumis melo var. makuwa]